MKRNFLSQANALFIGFSFIFISFLILFFPALSYALDWETEIVGAGDGGWPWF